jgi:magnesium chelatase subunit D
VTPPGDADRPAAAAGGATAAAAAGTASRPGASGGAGPAPEGGSAAGRADAGEGRGAGPGVGADGFVAPPDPWDDACAAADLLALDPSGLGGARLRGSPGPARDLWLARLRAGLPPAAPMRRLPAGASEDRLLGGLDLAATLAAGRPVARAGLLAEAAGGVLTLPSAERADARLAGLLSRALDGADGAAPAVAAFDEGAAPDERPPAALTERLAFDLDLGAPRPRAVPQRDLTVARALLAGATVPAELLAALAEAAETLGVASPRGLIFAARAARAAAALAGRTVAATEDAALAARLALGWRATHPPAADAPPPDAPEPDAPEPDATPPDATPPEGTDAPPPVADPDPSDAAATLADLLVEAARATLPAGLLAAAAAAERGRAQGEAGGSAGVLRRSTARGRPIASRPGRPDAGARLDLVETLRAAAPWQPLRREADPRPDAPLVRVRREDFRIRRFRRPAESVTIFLVDASGSAAAQRLAEAKGAVELLLAESYVRRDRVALVAFRGTKAEPVLPPTRALARAKRALGGLPGGGGTPLAAALDAGLAEAEAARRHGWTPTLVLLTDGRANVARDGTGGRARAAADAAQAAGRIRARGVAALLIDSGARPNPDAAALAAEMGARYLALPRADDAAVAAAVRAKPGR